MESIVVYTAMMLSCLLKMSQTEEKRCYLEISSETTSTEWIGIVVILGVVVSDQRIVGYGENQRIMRKNIE